MANMIPQATSPISGVQPIQRIWLEFLRGLTIDTDALMSEHANVKSYGAKGDGVTDDSAAFVAAMSSLPTNGGIVVVPDSAYGYKLASTINTTKPIEFRIGNTTIYGPGSGYVFKISHNGSRIIGSASTTLKVSSGGAGGIQNADALGTTYERLTIDTNNVANAIGFDHYGGWYVSVRDIEILRTTAAASSVGFKIYSRTLGVPGPTGSWGGAYVCKYENVRGKDIRIDSDGTSTATTFTFINAEVWYVSIARSRAITFIQPIVQASNFNSTLWDIADSDAVTVIGGDMERGGCTTDHTIYNLTGSVRALKSIGNLLGTFNAGGHSDTYVGGSPGMDCVFDDFREVGFTAPLRTGSGGTAGARFQNTGWAIRHNFGIHYSGDTFDIGSNLNLLSAISGNLDDTSNAGFALEFNSSHQVIGRGATAGANPRVVSELFRFDNRGGQLPNLPVHANNAAAVAAGEVVGRLYRTGADPDPVCVVH